MNLSLLILSPLITALLIVAMRHSWQAKWIALIGSCAQLILALFLYASFRTEFSEHPHQLFYFEQQFDWLPAWNIGWHAGVDGMSVAMILLTSVVVIAGVLVSWNVQKMPREFFLLLVMLSLGAYGFFISLDLFILFFFLEIAVIPKYLLIGIWGSGKKEYSANKLALMLMAGSALILVAMLAVYFAMPDHTFDMAAIAKVNLPVSLQHWCFPLLFIGFGIFTAIFPFHTWVPDGHSSAPTAGSMFLAGISMKLGGYGCLRVASFLMPDGAQEYANIIIVLSAVGILYGALATMMQKDLKYLNAYSSISHCGFVLLGIGMLNKTAMSGAVLQMVSHGLMTALFFAVIGMIYERTHTRDVREMGGLMRSMPFITTLFFIVGLCSLGLPGLSGFVAEMEIFVGSWQTSDVLHRTATIVACASIVVTAVYILRAIGQTAMGPIRQEFAQLTDAAWNEKLAGMVLLFGILAMGLMPGWLNSLVAPAVDNIVQRMVH